jgi:esterase/lipase
MKRLSGMSLPDLSANGKEWLRFQLVERKYVNKYGGGPEHKERSMWPAAKMLFNAEEYTFKEKINYLRGSKFSLENLLAEEIRRNLFTEIDSMHIPIYILQGIHDYQTPHVVAKDFFDHLKAPEKEFFTFENSAHCPLTEEVEKFNSIIRSKVQN